MADGVTLVGRGGEGQFAEVSAWRVGWQHYSTALDQIRYYTEVYTC